MSYYVEYNPELSEKYPILHKNRGIATQRWLIGLIVSGILLCSLARKEVREFLIPGDSEITVQAANELLEDIKNGSSWMDAFAVFCEAVVSGEI